MFRFIFFQKYKLDFFDQGRRWKDLLSKERRPVNPINFDFALNPDGPQLPKLLVIWTHLRFENHVSAEKLIPFLLSKGKCKGSYLFRNIVLIRFDFNPCSGIPMDQKCGRMLCFLDMPGYSDLYFCSAVLASFFYKRHNQQFFT